MLVVDALAAGTGHRRFTRDFIGAGPRLVAGLLERESRGTLRARVTRIESLLNGEWERDRWDALFLSGMSMDEPACGKLLASSSPRFKADRPRTVLGGPITLDLGVASRLAVDWVVIREGELAIRAIARDFPAFQQGDLQETSSLGLFARETLPSTFPPARPLSKSEWNSIPPLVKHAQDYTDYQSARVIVECVRGCSNYFRPIISLPNQPECAEGCQRCRETPTSTCCPQGKPPGCAYCSTISMFGPPKSRALPLIAEEISALAELGVSRIVLGASDLLEYQREEISPTGENTTPTIPPPPNYLALEALVSKLLDINAEFDGALHFSVENLKSSLCTTKALKILARLPDPVFSLGVETGDFEHARILGRPGDPARAVKVVRLAKRLGFRVHAYFIHSLPGLTPSRARNTIQMMRRLHEEEIDKITIYQFKSLPGSYLEAWPEGVPKATRSQIKRVGRKVRDAAISINENIKATFVGQVIRVHVAERNNRVPGNAIGRIYHGGPLIDVKNGVQYLHQDVRVKVTRVLSDKLLSGEVVMSELQNDDRR